MNEAIDKAESPDDAERFSRMQIPDEQDLIRALRIAWHSAAFGISFTRGVSSVITILHSRHPGRRNIEISPKKRGQY